MMQQKFSKFTHIVNWYQWWWGPEINVGSSGGRDPKSMFKYKHSKIGVNFKNIGKGQGKSRKWREKVQPLQ